MKVPELIAHRGASKQHPENTLIALESALNSGATYIEFDVQLCKDGIPVVIHDSNLLRTTGIDKSIFDITSLEAQQIPVGKPEKYDKVYNNVSDKTPDNISNKISNNVFIPTLEEVIKLISAWPDITAFVEIKRASLKQFNKEELLRKIIRLIAPVKNQCVIISFDKHAIEIARKFGAQQIGWVFEPWDPCHENSARKLSPEYIFTDYSSFPKRHNSLWPGPWKWVLYEINEPKLILEFAHLGADLIETNNIAELMQEPLFKKPAITAT